MHIVRFRDGDGTVGVGRLDGTDIRTIPRHDSIAGLLSLRRSELQAALELEGESVHDVMLLPPVDGRTEVWASGVTYERSREARVEESEQKSVYELVYDADRPELFFKSVAWRVVGDTENIAIRADSSLNVPEPELAVVSNRFGEIIGYLVSDDVSSRSIEGANPLYLPQAKIYAGACALSSGIRPAWELDASDLAVRLTVVRNDERVFEETTSTSRLHRPLTELVDYLYRAENFPDGAVLSTGTGIVPGMAFSLRNGDSVEIEIEGVGRLRNTVVTGPENFEYLTRTKR